MAKIALRVYNREIESLIEGGQLDEAIAHCQHILKSFPMHVETYRLLGKAHLEGRRYTDAADIFLRVLQAVPDDFVAHVGMSIIRDNENSLDEAIWHMERAFEVQPSNPAIQGELRRLYGRRDGVEPPRIRLSRDALANMYAQGELFNQAIAEIRSVLAEDANRPDLQVMLARAHFRAGQKVEAAEMAIQLLKKYPNCMDAMRILLDVLPGTTRSEDTQVYRPRLLVLDPYAAFVTGSVFQSEQVADAAVSLERLEYRPATTGAPAKSDWAASLGVKMDDDSKNEKQPAWLTPPAESDSALAPAAAPDPSTGSTGSPQAEQRLAPAVASSGGDIPSWLREAGWHGSAGEAKEGPMDLSDEPKDAEPLAPAEIPDWLQSMAPPEVTGAAAAEPAAPPADAGGLPDWLDEMKSETPAAPAPEPEKPRPAPLDESAPVGPTGPSKPLGIEDDAMAWLESLAAKQGAKPEELLTRPEDRPTEAPATVARLSDEAAAPSAPRPAPLDESAPAGPTGPSKPLGIEDDAMGWLESLAAKQGARPEELLTRPEDRPAEAPAAVARLSEEAAAQPAKPEWPPEEASASLPPAGSDDTISTWLKNLDETELPAEAPQPAPAETLPAQATDLPDWLKDLERPAPAAEAAPAPASDEGLPEWLSGPAAPAPAEESPVWARDEAAPVVEPPAPTIPGEWVPADAAGPVEAQPAAPAPAPVPASRPSPTKPTGSLARIPEKEKDADILAAAQSALNNNRLDEAIQLYIKLIKKARLLEEVIHDLREAIYRFPVDIIVWQTLGDAYMRANRLQDALDAYTKAEELLR